MELSKFVEEKIQKAIDEGEFDNLAGRGKPIDNDKVKRRIKILMRLFRNLYQFKSRKAYYPLSIIHYFAELFSANGDHLQNN